MKVVVPIVYVGVVLVVVALVDAGVDEVVFVWSAASFGLGWIMRWPWVSALPLLACPIAVPFGYPAEWSGRDALPLWFEMLAASLGEAVIVVVGFGARHLYERVRASDA